ncbi:MAG: GNAT family N-acetyltransferase [Anaerolineales bacterium]|nr:GNAT family N-acetyltransferase [Anaerolineales bacterium]
MSIWKLGNRYILRILDKPDEITAVEDLQRVVWPGDETEVIPAHLMLAAVHNGGLLIGAYENSASEGAETLSSFSPPGTTSLPENARMVGFTFGFPGLYHTPQGPRPKHCSHMLAVHPDFRDQGLGFVLKRAQWQMVRHQGLDRITWTYDPLLSRNAHLNITRLGAVCSTYLPDAYGQMRDGLNVGLSSDRFQVDWWINSERVNLRLSLKPRRPLELVHYLEADIPLVNPSQLNKAGLPSPSGPFEIDPQAVMAMVEIPADFLALKAADPSLAGEWRLHTRSIFMDLFQRGFLATDFVYLPGANARSFYILSFGEATL